ncbi:hypothetical protein LUZ60_012121 [Juncus effusus]|nr:hypothetical protein LUZ60_012121 [Juncus effusus]
MASLVFEMGKLDVKITTKNSDNDELSPPKSVLIASPIDMGTYPVMLLLHGFFLRNNYYQQLIQHIASHGFIVVAPQLFNIIPQSSMEDVESAASVTNWLSVGLQSLLPNGVNANFEKVVLAGHSRGGHAAFAVALGHAQTTLKFAALIGIDPVAGMSESSQVLPKILTYEPSSFDLDIPVLVIGSGLGEEQTICFAPACTPEGVNHKEFYYECKPPCYHLVVSNYGHLDVLDDKAFNLVTKCACKNGKNRDIMRRCSAGVIIAFLKDYFEKETGYLKAILSDPGIAPGKLDPVEYRV